jgi:cholesterol transport system auxiliary component
MKTILKFQAAATALLLASACSILPESEPVQLLDPQLQSPPVANQDVAWTLNVARPESDPARDSARVLVRTGQGQLQVHASARWVAAAPELLRTRLVRYLRDSQRIGQVSAGGGGLDRTLALDLRAFELVETGDGRLAAEIRIEARVYDSRSAELLARELFEARRPVSGAGPAEIVEGFEAVLGQIIPALADWLTD